MTTADALSARPTIDPARWPDLAATRRRAARRLRAEVARRIFRSAVGRLDVRVELPDAVLGRGAGRAGAPVMRIARPDAFFAAVGSDGLIGFGESYMAGDWEAPDLARLLEVFATEVATLVPAPLQRLRALWAARTPRSDLNTARNTRRNIARHYDLSNDLFAAFLDATMSYSCALFDGDVSSVGAVAGEVAGRSEPHRRPAWDDLAPAQACKIDRILDAAGVGSGTRVLEIGSGWGELAIRAARRGASVLTITLSSEQQQLARQRVAEAGVCDRVAVELLDYRQVDGEFDSVVSVEMVEAVGHEYWPTYFRTIDRVLAPGGRAVVQAITMPHDRMLVTRGGYTWINKYIFPGGFLPSTRALAQAARDHTGLRLARRLSFGSHYAHTLRLWDERFVDALDRVRQLGFDEVFDRMWHFYLQYSEAGFRSGYLDVHQLVFRREGEV